MEFYDYCYILKWYHSLDSKDQETWKCDFCKKKKLHIARNCNNEFEETVIVLTNNYFVKQCPLSKLNPIYGEVYSILKMTLNSEMGFSLSPIELLKIPNKWFDYSEKLNKAENDFDRDKKEK